MRNPLIALFLSIALTGFYSSRAADQQIKKKDKPKKSKVEILFDGKSTDHFRGYKRTDFPTKGWTVENGLLKTNPNGEVVDIVTKEDYDNFDLQFEWKVTPAANSGVMYRANEDYEEAWHTGPEYQILDDEKHADGKNPKTTAGALYALIAPRDKELKPVGEWNRARIVAQGRHVEHYLNGKKVVEYEWGSPELQALIAKSKFAPMPKFAKLDNGKIVFQHHKDEVCYRNIKIRRLPPS